MYRARKAVETPIRQLTGFLVCTILLSLACGSRTNLADNVPTSFGDSPSIDLGRSTGGATPSGGNPSNGGTNGTGSTTSTGGAAALGGSAGLRHVYVPCGKVECDLSETVCCLTDRCVPKVDPYSSCHSPYDTGPDMLGCDEASDCENGQVCCSLWCRGAYNVFMKCMAASDCAQIDPGHCILRQACNPAVTNPTECLIGACSQADARLGITICGE